MNNKIQAGRRVASRRNRVHRTRNILAGAVTVASLCVAAGTASAGITESFGEDKSVSLGLGLRGSFTSTENGAPNGKSRSTDFNLDSVRIYMGASLTKSIKATFNTERDGDGHIRLLDGFARFEPMDEFNIWAGRLLPPSDRANLDGPYYLNAWSYPGVVSQYPARFAGRDDGVTVWGKLAEKHLVYAVGAFLGHNRLAGASNQGDNILYAGRVTYNFLDPEDDPGYFTSSTYYGSADILAVGVAGMYQKHGVGTAAKPGDYKSFNVDLLAEHKLGDDIGTATLEGAYYHYGTGGAIDVSPSFGGAGSTANVGGIADGDAYLIGVAYLLPGKVGWGKFQPYARYQKFLNDTSGGYAREYDAGVNYVIDGHNARISLDYASMKGTGSTGSTDRFIVGVQLQF
jgi:hypothetical protein